MSNIKNGVNTKRSITLNNGQVFTVMHDTMNCPVCMNGNADYVGVDSENAVFQCANCGAVVTVGFIDMKCEEIDKTSQDYV